MAMRTGRRWVVQVRTAASAAHAEIEGPPHKAQLGNTIGYYLAAQARRLGHKDAFRVPHQGVSWSYIEMKKNADALAHGFLDYGAKPGDRVLSIQPSNAEQFMVQAACAKLGMMAVLIDPYTLNLDNLPLAIDRFQPTTIVVREFCDMPTPKGPKKRSLHELVYQTMPELDQVIGEAFVRAPRYPSVKHVIVTDMNENLPGTRPMRRNLVWGPFSYYENRLRRVAPLLTPDNPCLVLPEGRLENERSIVYTHRNIMTAAYHAASQLKLTSDTRVIVAPNAGHLPVTAIIAHYACIAAGSCLSYGGEHLHHDSHVGTFLENVEQEHAEGVFLTKAALDLITPAVRGSGEGLGTRLKWICIVDDFDTMYDEITPAFVKSVKEDFKIDTVHVFRGPLEACSSLTMTTYGKDAVTESLTPNAALRVTGDEGGAQAKTLGRGHVGGLRLRGPSIASQYWNNGGLMQLDVDVQGYWDLQKDATVSDQGKLALKARSA
eukprot:Sspe_Gene.11569::Locus_3927_Transcript_1_2_Confidence_0.500_Length_1726::g.11569::m.11569/K00666/K00666; fatty-acyl-CoA synthase